VLDLLVNLCLVKPSFSMPAAMRGRVVVPFASAGRRGATCPSQAQDRETRRGSDRRNRHRRAPQNRPLSQYLFNDWPAQPELAWQACRLPPRSCASFWAHLYISVGKHILKLTSTRGIEVSRVVDRSVL